MSKHTPGPWVAHPAHTRNRTHPSVDTLAGAVPVASCRAYPDTTAARAEAYANARLIAAAPDLLEALRHLVDASDSQGLICGPGLIDRARVAIAKATGEEQ